MSKDYGRAGLHPRQNHLKGGHVRPPYRFEIINEQSKQKAGVKWKK